MTAMRLTRMFHEWDMRDFQYNYARHQHRGSQREEAVNP